MPMPADLGAASMQAPVSVAGSPRFAAGGGLGGSFGASLPRVANPHAIPFHFIVSVSALICAEGRVLPRAGKASWEAGLGGNAGLVSPMDHKGAGFRTALENDGWMTVPHNVPAIAWKVDRLSVPTDSTYLVRHEVERMADRQRVGHWTDAWTRLVPFGVESRLERDHAGWLAWLESLIPMIGRGPTGGLADYQIDHACSPYLSELHSLMRVSAPSHGHRSRAQILLHHLPESHRPKAALEFVGGR
jgi:hypothetical protein